MVFSNSLFIFMFLPLVTLVYYISKNSVRNYILLFASLIFYSVGEPYFVFVMIASIVLNYFIALGIERARSHDEPINARVKGLLILAVVLNIGLLFVFKYLDFAIGSFNLIFGRDISKFGIVLPIGISFFTFQALSYVIDVYRGEVKAQHSIFNLGLYISFFPQLIAGPIVRYQTIEEQISNRETTLDKYSQGICRFIIGFAKKLIIANNLSLITEKYFGEALCENAAILWIASISFSLQIYYDFSGYSDMAIGLGKMFGFDFMENFNYPYCAKNITDFWRRWHISLSSWFRDYVYIPLGGSRVSVPRHVFNLLVVWLLTGLWHGANYTFIVWGLLYFVLLVFEKFIIFPWTSKMSDFAAKTVSVIWRIISLIFVNFAWVIFNSNSLSFAVRFCGRMLGLGNTAKWLIDIETLGLLRRYGFFIVLGLIFSMPIVKTVLAHIENNAAWRRIRVVVIPVVYVSLFVISLSYIVMGAHNPFLYFNF